MSTERPFSAQRACAPLALAGLSLLVPSAPAQQLTTQFAGTQLGGMQGYSISSGFDCDGDGIADIAVGAPYEDTSGFVNEGFVRVYSGATRAPIWGYVPYSANALAGDSVALVGDVDGDGYGDVAFGAPGMNNGDGFIGVWSIQADQFLWYVYGASGEGLGTSVAAAGDVDHDGHMDVLAGAPGAGKVYLYGWNTGVLHAWSGSASAGFGRIVTGNVDVDGDGTPDVLVGAPHSSSAFPFSQDRGRIDVFSGATYATLWSALGDHAGDEFGTAICGCGDLNGDGLSEVLVGAPHVSTNGTDSGLVRLLDGTGAVLSDAFGLVANQQYGAAVAMIPDLNGDGVPEYAIGATESGAGGFVELHSGRTGTLDWTFVPPDGSYSEYGFALAGGDVDGDGFGDVIVGDPTRTVSGMFAAGDADVWRTAAAHTETYGTGYPGTNGVPSFSAPFDPGIGESFSVVVGNSRGSATAGLVFLGFSRISVPTSAGGTLLVAPLEVLPLPIPVAGATLSGTIPFDPALLGIVLDLQVIESDPGAAHKLSFTAGLEVSIGVDY